MAKVVLKLGDDVSTDIIYPGRFMATVLPTETPQYAFVDMPEFNAKFKKGEIPVGSVIAAGKNFGCGSSREQAPQSIKAAGIKAVIAKSFARIFYRNAFNIGLCLVECDTDSISDSDILELDFQNNRVKNVTKNSLIPIKPIPQVMKKLLADGGVIEHFKKYKGVKFDA